MVHVLRDIYPKYFYVKGEEDSIKEGRPNKRDGERTWEGGRKRDKGTKGNVTQ
jgi:hypothetical protein